MAQIRRTSAGRTAIGLLAALTLSACTIGSYDDAVKEFNRSNGGPPAAGDPPPPPPPPPGAGFGPNFSEIQAAVFTPTCATSSCHSGGAPSAGLNLDAASSYMSLVDMASGQDGGLLLVNRGNPNDSYLIRKLEGAAGIVNSQMPPPPATPLAQADIDVIRQWITEGAIDDRVVASTPIRVASLSPAPNADLADAPTIITAGFDRRPDQGTVSDQSFVVTSAGGGAVAGTVSVPAGNPQSARFEPAATLADGTYTIRLRGDGASAILDEDGNRLNGEYVNAFPSGNATEGGDFVVQFTITSPPMIGATLAEIQAAVFTPTCATSTCHSGAMPDGNLDLSAGASYANLVNVAADNPSDQIRVIPNDADNSYLVRKIEGGPNIVGNRMPPPPASALDPAYITAIRNWIDAGANP